MKVTTTRPTIGDAKATLRGWLALPLLPLLGMAYARPAAAAEPAPAPASDPVFAPAPAPELAPAPTPELTPEPTPAPAPQVYWPARRVKAKRDRPDLWQLTLGVRTTLIRGAAFDHFAKTDAMPQLSSTVTRVVAAQGQLALHVGAAVDLGSSDAPVRNAQATLTLQRGAFLVDARFRPHWRVQAFARLAPGVLRGTAELAEDSAIGTMDQTFTLLSIDGSAGAAVQLTPANAGVGFWLVGEGGYGWTPSQHLVLSPHLAARDQDKAGTLDFGTLAPRGPFFRVALGLSF